MTEKIQKVLARIGLGSRREIEQWIKDGRVKVDGRVAQLGDRITTKVKLKVNGKVVRLGEASSKTRVILYHKPAGEICSRKDEQGRKTVFDALPHIHSGRWISIGRLDLSTSGLLMFTNDGELANRLMHPATQIEREYAVRILGPVNDEVLKKITHGVQLEDGLARFEHVVPSGGSGANRWFHVVVMEGRNRLVRHLWESQELTVSRLIRVRFGPVFLPKSVIQGKWIELKDNALQELINVSEVEKGLKS